MKKNFRWKEWPEQSVIRIPKKVYEFDKAPCMWVTTNDLVSEYKHDERWIDAHQYPPEWNMEKGEVGMLRAADGEIVLRVMVP